MVKMQSGEPIQIKVMGDCWEVAIVTENSVDGNFKALGLDGNIRTLKMDDYETHWKY